ncbi:MAG: S-layer homology domain-containing protein, partial [Clostridia bacterium]|nr:S-layer homology domain-containing protein [Clostridia bacterium]
MKKMISFVITLAMLLGVLAAAAVSAGDFPFTDVKETRWSRKSVEYAYEMKYMDGVGDGKFDPAGTMTRAMAVTVLYRKEGSPAADFKADFTDVKAGKYYSNAVIWAKNNNIVNGVSEG